MCNAKTINMKNLIITILLILTKTISSQDCDFIDIPRNELDKGGNKVTSGDYYIIINEYEGEDNPLKAIYYHFDRKNPSATTPCVFVDLVFKAKYEEKIRMRFKSQYPKYDEKSDSYSSNESNPYNNCMAYPLEKSEQNKNYFIVRCTKLKYVSYITE
jgi:hypothetical protein